MEKQLDCYLRNVQYANESEVQFFLDKMQEAERLFAEGRKIRDEAFCLYKKLFPRLIKTNKSGVNCVSWHKRDKKWQARIRIGGKVKHIGYFTKLDEAEEAVLSAREQLRSFGELNGHPKP